MNSIIQADREHCYFCGKAATETHHVFAGVANRRISETYGLTVYLCHDCHTGTEGAQYNKERNLQLKQDAQRAYQRYYSKQSWMMLIRKNYLG